MGLITCLRIFQISSWYICLHRCCLAKNGLRLFLKNQANKQTKKKKPTVCRESCSMAMNMNLHHRLNKTHCALRLTVFTVHFINYSPKDGYFGFFQLFIILTTCLTLPVPPPAEFPLLLPSMESQLRAEGKREGRGLRKQFPQVAEAGAWVGSAW